MSTKVQAKIIDLVKIKSWYIPRDAESYQTLNSLGVPLLLIPKDFLPTLQLVTRRHNVRAKETLWMDIFHKRLDETGALWKSRMDRSCKLGDTKLIFLAKVSSLNREAITKLETSLAKFFARWSFRYYPTFSETLDRYKLVVEFRFDAELQPIMPSVVPEPKTEYEWVIGFTKVRLTFYDKNTEDTRKNGIIAPLTVLQVYAQTGSTWEPVYRSTFKPNQIGDMGQFLSAMGILYGRMKTREQ